MGRPFIITAVATITITAMDTAITVTTAITATIADRSQSGRCQRRPAALSSGG